jgi:C4-dicarboxylate-specific signal transduction histidine kinase
MARASGHCRGGRELQVGSGLQLAIKTHRVRQAVLACCSILFSYSPWQGPPIEGNEVRIKFMLTSLIENALDALLNRPERAVNIRTGRAKGGCYFEVLDSGCGIPGENLPGLFSPFFFAKG